MEGESSPSQNPEPVCRNRSGTSRATYEDSETKSNPSVGRRLDLVSWFMSRSRFFPRCYTRSAKDASSILHMSVKHDTRFPLIKDPFVGSVDIALNELLHMCENATGM